MKVEKVQNYKILIVEDDRGLAQGIAMALKEENTLFLQAYSLEEARKLWKTPLANILLYAELLEEKTSDPEEQVLAQILGRFYRGRQVQQEDGLESDCTWHGKFCRRRMAISKWNPSREREAHLAYLFQNCKISERIWKEQNCILPYTKR